MKRLESQMGIAMTAAILCSTSVLHAAPVTTIAVESSDLTATALLVVGIILLMLEVKIVSQGILGFIGSVFLITAGVIIWRDGTAFWGMPVGWIIPLIGVTVILAAILTWLGIKAQQEKVTTGYQGYIGEIAEVREALNPEGRVFFQGTYWQALSQIPIAPGEKVRIIGADRLVLVVEPLTTPAISGETILDSTTQHV